MCIDQPKIFWKTIHNYYYFLFSLHVYNRFLKIYKKKAISKNTLGGVQKSISNWNSFRARERLRQTWFFFFGKERQILRLCVRTAQRSISLLICNGKIEIRHFNYCILLLSCTVRNLCIKISIFFSLIRLLN